MSKYSSEKEILSVVSGFENGLIENYDKDELLKFYSREVLFSDEVRGKFVDDDLGTF